MASIQETFINLRNDLKTWITNNLKLKANKADLIALDGTKFRFGVDSDGKYGFIMKDDEGSDIVIPFSASRDDLLEALKYSKIVTDDMSFEEICTALSNRFPEVLNLYTSSANEGGFVLWEKIYGSNGTISFGNEMTIRQTTRGASRTRVYSKRIDLTSFDKLCFNHVSTASTGTTSYDWVIVTVDKGKQKINTNVTGIELIDKSNSIIIYTLLRGVTQSSGNVEIDISALTGEYYISFLMQNNNSSAVQTKISNMYLK